MKITVTQQCIDKAYNGHNVMKLVHHCLIATAFREAGFEDITVGVQCAGINKMMSGVLPTFVQQVILDFHKGKTVQPFEFDFEFTHLWRSKA